MSNKRLAGWAASSHTPEEVSNRVKGLILALSSVIIFVIAQVFNFQLSAADLTELATQLGAISGLIWALWGAGVALVRKVAEITE